MNKRNVCRNNTDCLIYDREIKPYLPSRIFDAHTHLLINSHYPNIDSVPLAADPLLGDVGMAYLEQWWRVLFPHASVNGLVMGFPSRGCNMPEINKYAAAHVASDNRFSLLVHPSMSTGTLEELILRYRPAGLKPYMVFAEVNDVQQAGICDMIPEHQITLADKYKLAVTLHVSKPRGMADLQNLSDIRRLVEKYPECNFILAHCGRCFIPPNMEDALKGLPVASNLWMDTSAVCDIGVFELLFGGFDRSRILFGTDLVTASGIRGTYVRIGMQWQWVTSAQLTPVGKKPIEATFAAYENLCAMLYAAKFCKLKKVELENIFFNNASRLFKLY